MVLFKNRRDLFLYKIENDIGECILWQIILCYIKIELK